VNPGVRIRLVHAKQGRVHLLDRPQFDIAQDEQQLVGQDPQGTIPILTIATLGARLSVECVLLNMFLKLNLKEGQESLEFFQHISGQGQELGGILRQLVVIGHGKCIPW
jgi:hypothetical protein